MKDRPNSDATVNFYDQTAAAFDESTRSVDMLHLYAEFLPLVKKGGAILDAGCGSGRDSAFFKKRGFSITAFDASSELASIATQTIGEPVRVMTFLDVCSVGEFDGIWACASLLHVPNSEMDEVLRRLSRGLKARGVIYASFKYGNSEEFRGGRFFNDFDESKLAELLRTVSALRQLKSWVTSDARPGREHELWLNVILEKCGSSDETAQRRQHGD
jgi:2-polyprenyl-3-methyl-5-hydroxy-6-metoxy-1,4-benzoquinol methylase